MKTLDQIEARTPISSLPYTISASGSYYLTKNLVASGGTAGITVSADNVTIDLGGFALTSDGSGTASGINVPTTQKNLCVRNGTVSGWHNACIEAFNAYYPVFEKLRLSGSVTSLGLDAGVGATIKSCTAQGNSTLGIGVNGNSKVIDCMCSNNGSGIDAFGSATVLDCTCNDNTGTGISTGNSCTIVNCTATFNNGDNILTNQSCTVAHCTVNSGGSGIRTGSNCLVENCTVAGCSGVGINAASFNAASSTVRGCEVNFCAQAGILVSSSSVVAHNSLVGNNYSGSGSAGGVVASGSGNRIEGNNFVANLTAAIYISSGTSTHITGNLIVGNSFSGALYIIDSGNTVGPLVNMSAGGGTLSTSANPLANIAY